MVLPLPAPATVPVGVLPIILVPPVGLLVEEMPDVVLPVVVAAINPPIVPLILSGPVLPGVGTPEALGESVMGALLAGGGWPGSALTMRSPNCSGVVSRPSVSMGS